jgi:hypothetical protein
MLANLKIICQFHAHSVHQNSVEIFWAEIYRGRLFCRAEIYWGRLLTFITGSSSRLLRIPFSADLTMYWFPVCHFRCMKFKPLVIWQYHYQLFNEISHLEECLRPYGYTMCNIYILYYVYGH